MSTLGRLAVPAALVLYALVLVPAAVAVWRRPVLALYAFVAGLALYDVTMALLYGAGVQGSAIGAIQSWKEILLTTAAISVAREAWIGRRLPFAPRAVDLLALAFAALVVLYALLPQGMLGGDSGLKGVVYAARHDLTPVLAYLVGRSLPLTRRQLGTLGWTLAATAAAVAAFGLIDLYAVPIEWWRDSGAPGFYAHQGYVYHGPGGLPENFVFNASGTVYRRLTSLFLSPLGTAYVLAIALLVLAAGWSRRRPWLVAGLAVLWSAALLMTLSRSTMAALAGGFLVLALALRRWWPVLPALATVAALVALNSAFPHIAPHSHFFPADLKYQSERAQQNGGTDVPGSLLSTGEPSIASHLHELKQGLRKISRHPQGFGLGNAGGTAVRFDAQPQAGESTYTEVGIETGALGLAAFVAWALTLLVMLGLRARRAIEETRRWALAGSTAAFALMLALAIQTDVLGVLWLAFGLWWVAGALLAEPGVAVARSAASTRSGSARPMMRRR